MGGKEDQFPERIPRPGVAAPEKYDGPTWATAEFDEIVSPEVLELMRGG